MADLYCKILLWMFMSFFLLQVSTFAYPYFFKQADANFKQHRENSIDGNCAQWNFTAHKHSR